MVELIHDREVVGWWENGLGGDVFFVKQKTAYELLRSLVGSEMCIRDRRGCATCLEPAVFVGTVAEGLARAGATAAQAQVGLCLLYTSDAADDLLCVDLGGRRITKKNNIPPAPLPPPSYHLPSPPAPPPPTAHQPIPPHRH